MEVISSQELIQKRFMKVFKFAQDDLLANRNGNLSMNQKKRILKQWIVALTIVGLIGCYIAFLFFVVFDVPISKTSFYGDAVVILTLVSLSIWFSWSHWKTYTSGAIEKLTGKVSWETGIHSIYLCIEGRRIPITVNIKGLFERDGIYNVYYAPLIYLIVAIEKV